MLFLFIIFCISILLNLLFFVLDVYPLFHHRKFKTSLKDSISYDEYIDRIVKGAFIMAKNRKGYFFNRVESNNVIEKIRYLLKHNSLSSFSVYNYHRAYLFGGLLTFLLKKEDDRFSSAKELFDQYLKEDGSPSFALNKIDQVVFGLAAIELFEYTKDEKYQKFARILFNYLESVKNESDIIQYRKGRVQLVDIIGMIVPFLIKYGNVFNSQKALTLAYNNINYYIRHGIDETTRLPFHGFNVYSNAKLGPTNWGRGIGWYILGLYYVIKYTNSNNNSYYEDHKFEYDSVRDFLRMESTDSLWTQFLGQTGSTDSSSSLLFLYTMGSYPDKEFKKNIHILKSLTTTRGMIDFSSGETIGVNRYSSGISCSELSQGILLYYLSENL